MLIVNVDFDSVAKYNAQFFHGNDIIAKGTLIVNYRDKLDPVGIIEDVWTHENHRKSGYGSKIVQALISKAKELNCFKVTLCCADHNIHFYENNGFKKNQTEMRIYLK